MITKSAKIDMPRDRIDNTHLTEIVLAILGGTPQGTGSENSSQAAVGMEDRQQGFCNSWAEGGGKERGEGGRTALAKKGWAGELCGGAAAARG